tara:strand:- start:4106 stop:4363 length:258 start_codon:yes stop_codon:yes gene_type:complete
MNEETKNSHWQIVQTICLIATAAGIFLSLGRRDQVLAINSTQITELRDITQDLVKSQVLSEANDTNHAIVLQELRVRIERLEQGK